MARDGAAKDVSSKRLESTSPRLGGDRAEQCVKGAGSSVKGRASGSGTLKLLELQIRKHSSDRLAALSLDIVAL